MRETEQLTDLEYVKTSSKIQSDLSSSILPQYRVLKL